MIRERGETLWDHLRDQPVPEGDSRFVWIAAERALVRTAKARFRDELGIRRDEGYFAFYWAA
jgi:NADPH-dependent ferric siderophore reductase